MSCLGAELDMAISTSDISTNKIFGICQSRMHLIYFRISTRVTAPPVSFQELVEELKIIFGNYSITFLSLKKSARGAFSGNDEYGRSKWG